MWEAVLRNAARLYCPCSEDSHRVQGKDGQGFSISRLEVQKLWMVSDTMQELHLLPLVPRIVFMSNFCGVPVTVRICIAGVLPAFLKLLPQATGLLFSLSATLASERAGWSGCRGMIKATAMRAVASKWSLSCAHIFFPVSAIPYVEIL